jgi:NADPH-dependent curcumin reductase CurA
MRGRGWQLDSRPKGEPAPSDFSLVEVDVPDPGEGEVLVRNSYLSVDPYMRGRMSDAKSYAAPYALGQLMHGGAVGEVVASNAPTHSPGDLVLHGQGWREVAVGPAREFSVVPPVEHPSHYLGVLGMPGHTAYAGLHRLGEFQAGQTVFVSGAAGAVGSIVGQLVTLGGGTAIGSAGSPEKVAWLRGLGFAAAFDYHDGPVTEQLAQAAPDGIDLYFDNVGGEHLEAALDALVVHGRAVICGMISQYNATAASPGPRNMRNFITNRLTMRGLLVSDHQDLLPEFRREVGAALAAGRLEARETVVEGIESAAEAFLGLLSGANTGKMVVRLT